MLSDVQNILHDQKIKVRNKTEYSNFNKIKLQTTLKLWNSWTKLASVHGLDVCQYVNCIVCNYVIMSERKC